MKQPLFRGSGKQVKRCKQGLHKYGKNNLCVFCGTPTASYKKDLAEMIDIVKQTEISKQ